MENIKTEENTHLINYLKSSIIVLIRDVFWISDLHAQF